MPELYLLASAITRHLGVLHANDSIGLIRAKGTLATRTGFLVSLISPNDPDDPEKVQLLRQAATELGIDV
jgi:hypothetical protein